MSVKGNQNAKGNRGGGRKSLYRPEYAKIAERMGLLGAIGETDAELAVVFGVSETTINAWKKAHPEFSEALKKGKAPADAMVANALYRKAVGYEHKAMKIFADPKTGAEVQVPYTERYAPDTVACIFWLKNRRPDLWRDRHAFEHTGRDGGPITVDDARTPLPVDPVARATLFGNLMAEAVQASPALRSELSLLAPHAPVMP